CRRIFCTVDCWKALGKRASLPHASHSSLRRSLTVARRQRKRMLFNIPKEYSMRTRTILLVVAILLVAGFAALNWSEMVRSTPLSFGIMVADAPLGLILMGLLVLTLLLFLGSAAAMRTQSLMEYRTHQKTLEAQRELADKAEASRFVELRNQMDQHLKAMRERDAIAATEVDKAMPQSRREMQAHMEQMNRLGRAP